MKYILYIATLLSSLSLCGMEKPQTSTAALLGTPSLANLPSDLKTKIIGHLCTSGTSLETAESLRNLSRINKQFYRLIHSPAATEMIINTLAPHTSIFDGQSALRTLHERVRAALDLFTPAAAAWLKKNKDNLQGDILYEFVRIFGYMQTQENKEKEFFYKKIAFLLHAGVNPNAKIQSIFPGSQVSLLKAAVWTYHNKRIAGLLITFGANINEIENGKTILDDLIEWVNDDDLPGPCYFTIEREKELIVYLRSKGAKTVAELQQEQST